MVQEAFREGNNLVSHNEVYYSKTAECTNVCRGRWITTAQFNWPSHLIVWQEERWRAGSVEDLSAANFPHATSNVWTVLTQDL